MDWLARVLALSREYNRLKLFEYIVRVYHQRVKAHNLLGGDKNHPKLKQLD